MIVFQADEETGYRSRTIKNASADVTLAFAVDFTTAGEKLTKKAVLEQGKLYIPININVFTSRQKLHDSILSVREQILSLKKPEISLNIAGNGIYRLKSTFINSQEMLNELMYRYLNDIVTVLGGYVKVAIIRTGGQSGFDEAGANAGVKLNIPVLVHAPKDWVYRDINEIDHYGEEQFKKRFKNKYE